MDRYIIPMQMTKVGALLGSI